VPNLLSIGLICRDPLLQPVPLQLLPLQRVWLCLLRRQTVQDAIATALSLPLSLSSSPCCAKFAPVGCIE
jgi:hypothetical protein